MQKREIKYPLKFRPVFKQTIWGGKKIGAFIDAGALRGGEADSLGSENIGECWTISAVKGYESVVSNGPLEGMRLSEVAEQYGRELMGKSNQERFQGQFPLLVKFIDAAKDLSVQVHPNDELAMKHHNCSGKSEMWYVIDAEEGATLLSGFNKELSKEEFKELDGESVVDSLTKFSIKSGDMFYLPAGTVHSIGAGSFIAEIQQSSDITYRIYDFNRVDASGNPRELHLKEALEAVDFSIKGDCCRIDYVNPQKKSDNVWDNAFEAVNGSHFSTFMVKLSNSGIKENSYLFNYAKLGSFVIITCVGGSALLNYGNGESISVTQGEAILLPADLEEVAFVLPPDGKCQFLETHIQ